MRVWFSSAVVAAGLSLGACFAPLDVGSGCTRDTDCADDLVCVRIESARVCLPERTNGNDVSEGEGETGEGEGETGEGEGETGEGEGETGEGEGEGGCVASERTVVAASASGAHVAARPGEIAVAFGEGPRLAFANPGTDAPLSTSLRVGDNNPDEFTTAVDLAFNAATNDWMVVYIHTSDQRELKLVTVDADTHAINERVTLRTTADNVVFDSNFLLVRADGTSVVMSSTANIDTAARSFAAVNITASMSASLVSLGSNMAVSGQPMLDADGSVLFALSNDAQPNHVVVKRLVGQALSTVHDDTANGNVQATVFVGTTPLVAWSEQNGATLEKSFFACALPCTDNTFRSGFSMINWAESGVASLGGDEWVVVGLGETTESSTPVPTLLTAHIKSDAVSPTSTPTAPAQMTGGASATALDGGYAAVYGEPAGNDRRIVLLTGCLP